MVYGLAGCDYVVVTRAACAHDLQVVDRRDIFECRIVMARFASI